MTLANLRKTHGGMTEIKPYLYVHGYRHCPFRFGGAKDDEDDYDEYISNERARRNLFA